MKIHIPIIFTFSMAIMPMSAQICNDPVLEKQLLESALVHAPLPLNIQKSHEALNERKAVSASTVLCADTIRLEFDTAPAKRAKGDPSDPDYAIYGRAEAHAVLKLTDWNDYNRVSFDVYPDCGGSRVVNVNVVVRNGYYDIKSGRNMPVGAHLVNLVNGKWNHCSLEVDECQRDSIVSLLFYTDIKGQDRSTGRKAAYKLCNICLEQVNQPTKVAGWVPDKGLISYSTTGYLPQSSKVAIMNADTKGKFLVIDVNTGVVAMSKQIEKKNSTTGKYSVLDFTELKTPGLYVIEAAGCVTDTFRIHERLWDDSEWRILNFLYGQRCGHPVAGKHGACHFDLTSIHDGVTIPYHGGWHDAGDLSQQTLHTAELAMNLLEASVACRNENAALSARLREEAEWGLDFILANRYGDGYHASSVGLLIWLDGRYGTFDDISTVRVQNHAFDNFIYSAVEAYSAMNLGHDEGLCQRLAEVSAEDFEFAMAKYKKDGYDKFEQPYEHTYSTPPSLFHAAISWASSLLYSLTEDDKYAKIAADEIAYVIRCQQAEPLDGFKGFFYYDDRRLTPVHWIHQSREQLYMQALSEICATQPSHPQYRQWLESIEAYGSYLKSLMPYTAPYAMIPSGVYFDNEPNDIESFYKLHIFPPSDATQRYEQQLGHGERVGKSVYVKRFPVWFNIFSGNTAVHLSAGRCAAICGRVLNDPTLTDMAVQQLYWTVGLNPFGQSLIYGEGSNYPQLDNFSSGESVGAIPVGIRTIGDSDEPYWPQINNACYKEVWVVSAGKWLGLISELM